MGYTPDNNPYVPGDPYSYDLKWQVENIKHMQTRFAELDENVQEATDQADRAEQEADRAAGRADFATEEADRATEEADRATEEADRAVSEGHAEVLKAEGFATGTQEGTPVSSGSPYYQNNSEYFSQQAAGSASEAADYAAHIADPVSGLVADWLEDHITQPSTPAIDTSLTVSTAAADSKIVGDNIFRMLCPILFMRDDYIDFDVSAGTITVPSWAQLIFNGSTITYNDPNVLSYTISNVTYDDYGTSIVYLCYDKSVSGPIISSNPYSIKKNADLTSGDAIIAMIRLDTDTTYPQITSLAPWRVNGSPYNLGEIVGLNNLAPLIFSRNTCISYNSVNGTIDVPDWGVMKHPEAWKTYNTRQQDGYWHFTNIFYATYNITTIFLVYDRSLSGVFDANPFSIKVSSALDPANDLVVAIIKTGYDPDGIKPSIVALAPWKIDGRMYGVRSEDMQLSYTIAPQSMQTQNKGTSIKVMSYNVAQYNDDTATYLSDEKVNNIRKVLNDLDPDIIGIQEDRPYIDSANTKSTNQYLFYPIYPNTHMHASGAGSCIRSKVNTTNNGSVVYTDGRKITYSTMTINDNSLLIIVTHPIANYNNTGVDSAASISARDTEYDELFKWADGDITLPDAATSEPTYSPIHKWVVILGDMNTITATDKTNLTAKAGNKNYIMANGGRLGWLITAPRYSGTMLSLDNIIVSQNVIINTVKTFPEMYADLYSDHIPITAKLTLVD